MPMVYIGRSILPDSGGAGKYRGGCAFVSTWLVNKTDHLRLVTSEHSSRVFDNAGMCGGYPAPTCQKHRAVRGPNLAERIEARLPLAHTIGTDPARSDFEKLLEGEHDTVEGPYITRPHRHGDIFSHSYNGGGGFGDVLERDPVKTALDVENGHLTEQAAREVFGIVVKPGAEPGMFVADTEATVALRKEMRARRLSHAIPVKDWIAAEGKRVNERRFAPEVRQMYAAAMRLSDRFRADFTTFWDLDHGFDMLEGEK